MSSNPQTKSSTPRTKSNAPQAKPARHTTVTPTAKPKPNNNPSGQRGDTKLDIDAIRAMADRGMNITHIASNFGISSPTFVRRLWIDYGLRVESRVIIYDPKEQS